MKRLSHTFIKVSQILSIVLAPFMAVLGFVFMLFTNEERNLEWLNEGSIHWTTDENLSNEELAKVIAITMIALVIMFFILAIFYAISASIFAKTKGKQNERKAMVTAIVFGVLSGTGFAIAGGILGIIATNRENRNKGEQLQ